MKQYALLAFLSPVASLLAVTGPAQSEKLKTKTNPQKQPNARTLTMMPGADWWMKASSNLLL